MKDKQKKTIAHGGKRLSASAPKVAEPAQNKEGSSVAQATQAVAPAPVKASKRRLKSWKSQVKACFERWSEKLGEVVQHWSEELPQESGFHKVVRIPRRLRQIWQEGCAKHFPESNRTLIQLILLAWGAIPGVVSIVAERVRRFRRHVTNALTLSTNPVRTRRAWHTPAFLAGAGVMVGIAIFCSLYTIGTMVTYGDVSVAVKSPDQVEAMFAQVQTASAMSLDQSFVLDQTQIEYSSAQILPRDMIVEADELIEDVSEQVSELVDTVEMGYALYVDGDFIGATPYEGALEEVLTQLKTSIVDENTISCDFAEEVEIREEILDEDDIINLGHLAELLYSTKEGEVTYTVVSGDVWSKIAQNNGLTSSELLAMNPGYNIDKLSIGEVLTISTAVPYLTITVQQREHYVAEVPHDIEYTDSADMYQGDYKVTFSGTNGTADTVANVTYVNGVEVERTILSSVNLQDPVTEQRLQGTMERPSWMATGTFRWPTSGNITSYFGYRSAFAGASTYHQGIDIANSYGTGIYAADGGTVTYAGWQSGYGYLVEINHGNGYTTRYGHNSSLLVSVGDKVYKGQQISRMGSTGVSSGNHCHFEIRYNGSAQNPLNYI